MYDKRRKIMSTLPCKSLNKALEQLRNLQLDNSFMYKNHQFIHAPSNETYPPSTYQGKSLLFI